MEFDEWTKGKPIEIYIIFYFLFANKTVLAKASITFSDVLVKKKKSFPVLRAVFKGYCRY